MKKSIFFFAIIMFSFSNLFAQSNSKWIEKLYDVECGLNKYENTQDYIVFHRDGTFEISINACEYGGGTYVGEVLLEGKFQKINNYDLKVTITEPFEFECNSGFAMKLSKTFIVRYNTLNNRSLVIIKGMKVFGNTSGGSYINTRNWDEGRYSYYFK